jgi:hypothetical protein
MLGQCIVSGLAIVSATIHVCQFAANCNRTRLAKLSRVQAISTDTADGATSSTSLPKGKDTIINRAYLPIYTQRGYVPACFYALIFFTSISKRFPRKFGLFCNPGNLNAKMYR